MEKRIPKKPICALVLVFLLLVLSVCLLFYFLGEGRFGGVFHRPSVSLTVSENGTVWYEDGTAPLLSSGEKNIHLKNGENFDLTLSFFSDGELLKSITLEKMSETTTDLILPKEGRISLALQAKKLSLGYVAADSDLEAIRSTLAEGGDLIFFGDLLLADLTLTAPFRLFGAFSFSELSVDTQREGNVVLYPDASFEAIIYVNAPAAKVYFQNFTLSASAEFTDYYIKAKSLNGQALNTALIPIFDFESLRRLSDPDLLPQPAEDSVIRFATPFSFSDSLELKGHFTVEFLSALDFGEHILSFSAEKEGSYRVTSELGTAPSAKSLLFSAPSSSLHWEGLGSIPRLETVEESWNLASYNGVQTSLGGEGVAVPSLSFSAAENDFLEEDAHFYVRGNQLLATLPFLVTPSDLDGGIYTLSCEGGEVRLEGDLSTGRVVTVDANGRERRFSVGILRENFQIPVVYLETENDSEITSKSQYVSATFSMDGEGTEIASVKETGIRIRGRGNSTWKWDKKPYKIHFDEPVSLLGLPAAEEWALFANYADKSLIRNRLAQVMASNLSFDYCPTQECVDVFLNGEYLGVYTLGEHLEEGEGRIEVAHDSTQIDCGFFLEAGGVVAGVDVKGLNYFHAGLVKFVLIKGPDNKTLTSEQFDYIMEYMQKADRAVKSGEGYEEYLDVDSLIDWLIMIELSNNTDCAWRRSTYFIKNPGEKVKMGPVWDFDLAFGNFSKDNAGYDIWVSSEPDDDYVGETWSTHLLEDSEFRARFKARWEEVRDRLLAVAMEEIDRSYEVLSPSAEQNFERWQILGKKVAFERHDTKNYKTFESQMQYLKDFLEKRAAWIDAQVENW